MARQRFASVHRLDDDPNQTQRLQFILSEHLYALWPEIDDNAEYRVDIGVTCLGTDEIPNEPKRGKRESDADWVRKKQKWETARTKAYDSWYDIQDERINEVHRIIVEGYGGTIDKINP